MIFGRKKRGRPAEEEIDKNVGFKIENYAGEYNTKDAMLLYAVTDRAWVGRQTLAEQVADAIKGGATGVQLREKHMPMVDFLVEAREIKALCAKHHVPLFIDNNVDVAVACGADGIHIGQDDMPLDEVRRIVGDKMMIGVSAHSVDEAVAAEKGGADYLGAGAVFGSKTKNDTHVLPRETLRAICNAVSIPVVAIGGIDEENIGELAGTGVAGAAIISAIFSANDITAACQRLRKASEAMIQKCD